MPGQRFTDSYLTGLKPAKSPYKKRDNSDVKGFGIQVSTGGTKTFFLSYTINGKAIYLNLGRFIPPVRESASTGASISNLVERREYARKLRAISESGIDPRQWIAEQEGSHTRGSFSDLLNAYLESLGYKSKEDLAALSPAGRALAESQMRPSAIHAAQIFDKDIVSAIDPSIPANTVTADMVTIALAKIVNRGAMTQANRAHSYLHAAFKHGLQYDHDPSSKNDEVRFYLSTNPVSAVKRPMKDEPTGDVDLSVDEIKQVWHALGVYKKMSVDAKNAIKLLLITGQRVETVLLAPKSEFDIERGIWDIPASRMKAKRSHVVPLHPMAIKLIALQMSIHKSPLLFPGRDVSKSMLPNSLSRAVLRFCDREKLRKFTPRDIRRTWKTRAGEIGISKSDRDHIQAHAIGSDVSSKHYDRYDYQAEKTAAMNAWCDYLQALVCGSNVAPIGHKTTAKTG